MFPWLQTTRAREVQALELKTMILKSLRNVKALNYTDTKLQLCFLYSERKIINRIQLIQKQVFKGLSLGPLYNYLTEFR